MMISDIFIGLFLILVFLLMGLLLIIAFPIILAYFGLSRVFNRIKSLIRGPISVKDLVQGDRIRFGDHVVVKDKGIFPEESLVAVRYEMDFPIRKELFIFETTEGCQLLVDSKEHKKTEDGYVLLEGEWSFFPPYEFLSVQ